MENPPEGPEVTSRRNNPQIPDPFLTIFRLVNWNN
jgi:hypothetical protein